MDRQQKRGTRLSSGAPSSDSQELQGGRPTLGNEEEAKEKERKTCRKKTQEMVQGAVALVILIWMETRQRRIFLERNCTPS